MLAFFLFLFFFLRFSFLDPPEEDTAAAIAGGVEKGTGAYLLTVTSIYCAVLNSAYPICPDPALSLSQDPLLFSVQPF